MRQSLLASPTWFRLPGPARITVLPWPHCDLRVSGEISGLRFGVNMPLQPARTSWSIRERGLVIFSLFSVSQLFSMVFIIAAVALFSSGLLQVALGFQTGPVMSVFLMLTLVAVLLMSGHYKALERVTKTIVIGFTDHTLHVAGGRPAGLVVVSTGFPRVRCAHCSFYCCPCWFHAPYRCLIPQSLDRGSGRSTAVWRQKKSRVSTSM